MVSAYQLVLNFQHFIVACWPQLTLLMENLDWDNDPYFVDKWLQSNWELMVERQLLDSGELLPPYGYDESPECRSSSIGAKPTHQLMVCDKNNRSVRFKFVNLISKSDGAVEFKPPFDYVGVRESGEISHLKIDQVLLEVEKIN